MKDQKKLYITKLNDSEISPKGITAIDHTDNVEQPLEAFSLMETVEVDSNVTEKDNWKKGIRPNIVMGLSIIAICVALAIIFGKSSKTSKSGSDFESKEMPVSQVAILESIINSLPKHTFDMADALQTDLEEEMYKDDAPWWFDSVDYLNQYTAPTSLTDDPTEPEVQIDGKVYHLPCPLKEFLDDGWEIKKIEEENREGEDFNILESKEMDVIIRLKKNGKNYLILGLTNYTDTRVDIRYTAVSCILLFSHLTDEKEYKDSPSGSEIVLPGGRSMHYTKEDLKDWFYNDERFTFEDLSEDGLLVEYFNAETRRYHDDDGTCLSNLVKCVYYYYIPAKPTKDGKDDEENELVISNYLWEY